MSARPRRKPAPTAVYWMMEGECLVRGTLDPVVALGLAISEVSNGGWNWEDAIEDRPDASPDNCPGADHAHAADTAEFCYWRLAPQNHRAGWYRRNIQPPESDYTWILGEPAGPGRGNFRAVLFDG